MHSARKTQFPPVPNSKQKFITEKMQRGLQAQEIYLSLNWEAGISQ